MRRVIRLGLVVMALALVGGPVSTSVTTASAGSQTGFFDGN